MAFIGNHSLLDKTKNDMNYVDIHGRQLRVVICEKTGEILIPLNEIRETGFNIYRKTQYNKTLIDDRELTKEFEMHLLDCAKNYILENKVTFNATQILQSIDNCKQALIGKKNGNSSLNSSDDFFKNRVIQGDSDAIQIQIKPEDNSLSQKIQHNKRASGGNPVCSVLNKSFEQSNDEEHGSEFPKLFVNSHEPKQYSLRLPNCNKDELLEDSHKASNGENTTINRQKLKCKAVLEISKAYSVIVSHLERKETVAWVQDIANVPLLMEISEKIVEEAERQSSITPVRTKIYAAYYQDKWYRCKVLETSPLTVLLIDYGNILKVDEVRPLSYDLRKMPQQGIRISFKNVIVKQDEEFQIIPLIRFDDGTYFVKIIKNPTHKNNSTPQLEQLNIENNEVFECFDLPDPLANLEDEMVVKIDKLTNNKLTLRTRISHSLYIEISHKLSIVQPEPLKNVKLNQIILYKNNDDDSYYRARVLENIDEEFVKIEHLDFYDEDIVPKQAIFAITEELSKFQLSYVPVKKFKSIKPLSIQQKRCIDNFIKQRIKFTVSLIDGEFDLKYTDENRQEISFLNANF